ncbi:putative chemotaxis transducer [Stutzerimonas degradans]|uniref:methyl-accepting chemotaxis protein n=1 Tax=Stutzerimonas TaxID=2901164 RepID=UPI00028C2465|nr:MULTISPECIES: methyl-accepting chemotaxis protein [Stutzerimonas]EKM96297.1 putative chemotaxis transducer [Stutzerimonas degradans]MCW3147008.1 methyl-accepting chemotaxis protein [Stutzerimonas sp. S1]
MLSNLSMKNKLLFTVLPLMLLIYLATVLLVYYQSKSSTEALAEVAVDAIARQQAAELSKHFDAPLNGLRNTAGLLAREMIDGELPDRRIADQIAESLLQGQPDTAAVWWIPQGGGADRSVLWLRSAGGLHPGLESQREALLTELGQVASDVERVVPLLSLDDRQVIALLVPIFSDEQVVGSLGVGLDAGLLQQQVAALRPLDVGVAALIAADNTLVAHPDPGRVGKKQQDTEADFLGDHFRAVIEAVRKGEGITLRFDSPALAEEAFMLVTPVTVSAAVTPWSLGLAFPSSALLGGVKSLALQLILLGIFASLVLALTMVLLGRAMARPLQQLVGTVRELATGDADLCARLPVRGADELTNLAREFNQFLETQWALVREIKATGQALQGVSDELQAESRNAERSVASQRDEIGQLATAMQQMAATVEEVAGNAGQAAVATQEGDQAVALGQAKVSGLVAAIHEDANTLEHVSTLATQLDEASQSIGTIVAVISDIADQTNLLALNASIESARAGEQGRGFAVVADEVRALARRTHLSTEQVCTSINLIQERTRTFVGIIEQSRRSSLGNVSSARQASEALESLSQIMRRMRDMSSQIATATEQQADTSDMLSRSLGSIADSAELASHGAGLVSQRSDDLEASAVSLNALVSRFRL